MTSALVWLLISITEGTTYNNGNVQIIERFPDKVQCEHVRSHIKNMDEWDKVVTRCVQAKIAVNK